MSMVAGTHQIASYDSSPLPPDEPYWAFDTMPTPAFRVENQGNPTLEKPSGPSPGPFEVFEDDQLLPLELDDTSVPSPDSWYLTAGLEQYFNDIQDYMDSFIDFQRTYSMSSYSYDVDAPGKSIVWQPTKQQCISTDVGIFDTVQEAETAGATMILCRPIRFLLISKDDGLATWPTIALFNFLNPGTIYSVMYPYNPPDETYVGADGEYLSVGFPAVNNVRFQKVTP